MREYLRVRYAGADVWLSVRLLCSWLREDWDGAGSEQKPFINPQIWAMFGARPDLQRVILVRGGGPAFLLFQDHAAYWSDVTHQLVEIRVMGEGSIS
jgi:hypothetical protein